MADVLDSPAAVDAAARGAAVRVAGYAAGVALSAAAAALLFRHLGVADAGRYVAVTSLASVAVQLLDGGLTSVSTRELSVLRGAEARRFLDEVLGVRLVLGAIGMLAAVALAAADGWSPLLVAGTLAAGAGVLLVAVAHNVASLLASRLRWGRVAAIELARVTANAAAIAALVAAGAGLGAFFAVPVASSLVALAASVAFTGHQRLPRPRAGVRRLRPLARELLPLAAAAAVAVAYLRVAMVLASAVGSATEAGTFAAAFRVVEVLSVVPFLAAGTVLPVLRRAAHADRGRYAATARRALGGCAGLGLAATAALVVAAPLVIRIVAGPAFEAAVPVLRIEALALGLAFVNAAFGVALLSLHLHREMLTTALAGLVAVTAAALALAPSHGAQGAALASVIGESVWLATAALLVRRRGALLATRTAATSP